MIDADTVPTVIPFVHTGMQEIMPIGTNFPRIGKQVSKQLCPLCQPLVTNFAIFCFSTIYLMHKN